AMLPCYGAIADVVAVLDAAPVNAGHALVGLALGVGDAVADGGDAQYAATAGDHLTVLLGGASVKYLYVLRIGLIQAADSIAFWIAARVAFGGHHHSQS